MTPSLLRTKFQKPILGDRILLRPRLLQRLDEGLAAKVTLVTAAAGYGKSTVVGSWIDALAARHDAWLSLDEEDNHFPRFLLYLVAAINTCYPHCCQDVSQLVQEHTDATIEMLTTVIVNDLAQQATPLVLVLDDVHRINDAAIFAFLTRLIEYAPSQLHLVLISRVDPPLPLNRWRARGFLSELRLHDLSFSRAETAEFLRGHLDHEPPAALIDTLHRRTEGWVVGNWLALLALRGRTDYAEFALHFEENAGRYAADYLVDEVLSAQPADVQRFLVSTAILNRFCAELSAAVLQIDSDEAQAQIAYLARVNLFLIELSTPAFWYRYHHQFQDMLLSRLQMRYGQAAIADLHRRAAAWLAAHRLIGEALSHLAAIPDHAAIADLIEQQRVNTLNELAFWELEAWLSQVPQPLLNQRAHLLVSMAWVKHDRVDNEACRNLSERAKILLQHESALFSETDRQVLTAELIALELSTEPGMHPETSRALIRQSWTLLRRNLTHTHCSVVLSLAYASQQLGDLGFALEIVRATLAEASAWPLVARCRIAHAAGFFYFCSGNSAEAVQQFQQNLVLATQHNLLIIGIISRHGLGAVADVQNRLEDAEEHHLNVVNRPYLTSGRDAVVDMYALIGLYARRNEPKKSRLLVEQLKEEAQLMGKSFFLEQVTALQAYADLTCGDVKRALRWALGTMHHEMETTADRIPSIRARILLADGSDACLALADQSVQRLIKFYSSSHVWYRQAEALILLALVREKQANPDAATTHLTAAVELAVPKGGVGLFMGYGVVMVHMLRRLRHQPTTSKLADLVLVVLDAEEESRSQNVDSSDLPDPLTEREMEVLELLADRYTNKEIARQLIVSHHTVRNHTASIYDKLQVSDRRAAVARAHALGLLPASP